jgi:hypothetical protein
VTITVTTPPPAAVSDLAVTATTDTIATLSFTQVDDGTGQPASYEIRYAPAPITFASATSVSRGTCATPIAGTTIGSIRTCTVIGLTPSTSYNFQARAFRGTFNVNAVFGPLSNVAAITTAPPAVASVSVSPATTSVGVGQTITLSATTRDAHGNVLTGRVITWTSGNAALASVSASGLVTGVSVGGPVTITATSEGQSGGAAVTVTPAPVASVAVAPASPSVMIGGTIQLTATTRDAGGNILTGRTITWSSGNSAVASVNATGLVTGVAAGGPVTVSATSEGITGTAAVTVTTPSLIGFVQGTANSRSGSSLAVSLPSPATSGDLIVVAFDFASANFKSISDSRGNVFTQIGSELTTPGGGRTRMYYAKNVLGGSETVTVGLTGSSSYVEVYVNEYRGVDITNPLDATVQRTGTAGSVTSGSATTTSANDLIMAYCVADASCTAGSGFTTRSTFNHNLVEDRLVSTPGSYAATGTANAGWGIIMAAFRPQQ